MAEKILMIALSPTMDQGMIARWNKKTGDRIAYGDVLCEVETDKATMEYESMVEGTLLHVVVPDKESATVGEPIAIVGKSDEDISDILAEIGDKTAVEPASQEPPDEQKKTTAPAPAVADANRRQKASPLARRLAQERGIDLYRISGSGPQGRIIKKDIEKATPAAQAALPSLAIPEKMVAEYLPISPKRRTIARRLSESKYSAPHYYLQLTVDMERLLQARDSLHPNSGRLSLNACFIKLTAIALQKHPLVNSCWCGDSIAQFATVDIGLAVAQTEGLVVPVVRDCAAKGIAQIDNELRNLIERARSGKLSPEEMQNATFTISNLGGFAIEAFTAIINPPGAAILALGQIMKEAVVGENDQIVIRQRMKATLSCDHRIIDGAVGAAFLRDWQALLQEPLLAVI